MDTIFTIETAIKKRSEHGLQSWVLFLDLDKAFDRETIQVWCPKEVSRFVESIT